jgi:hypothetical protein
MFWECEGKGTGSGSCAVVRYPISDDEPLGPNAGKVINVKRTAYPLLAISRQLLRRSAGIPSAVQRQALDKPNILYCSNGRS